MKFKNSQEKMQWQQDMLQEIEFLKRRLDDVKCLVLMYQSPFQALSYIKSHIRKVMDKMFMNGGN